MYSTDVVVWGLVLGIFSCTNLCTLMCAFSVLSFLRSAVVYSVCFRSALRMSSDDLRQSFTILSDTEQEI